MIFNLKKPLPVADVEPDEPTATKYSCNGTVLPALPEWDKEMYPYAVIVGTTLFVSSDPFEPKKFGDYNGYQVVYNSDMEAQVTDGAWTALSAVRITAGIGYDRWLITWSNYDMIDIDGNLTIAASDPVPVYE